MLGILVTLLLYFCLISWIAYRKKGSEEDYYQVKKAVPVTVLAFSVFATLLSPISFLTLVGNAYTGRSYLWFAQCGIFLAIPLAHRYFLPLYQKGNYETAYHLLEDKFQSSGIRSLASGLFILYQLGRIAVVTYLLSQALEPFIPINQLVLSGLLLLLTVYYLARGGLLVVLWTDFFQGLVLLAILALFLPRIAQSGLVLNSSQQLSHFTETLDGRLVLILVAGAGFSSLFSYVSSQDIVQRFNSEMGSQKIGKNLMAARPFVLWDCQFTVSDWLLDSSGKFCHHIDQSRSYCLRSGRSGTLVWQFHHAGSLGSRPIHGLVQYECNRDLFEVGFRRVKDSLVAKPPVLCHSRPVLAPLPLTHECRNLLHLRMD